MTRWSSLLRIRGPWILVGLMGAICAAYFGLAATPTEAQSGGQLAGPLDKKWIVKIIDDVQIPAQQKGVLMHLRSPVVDAQGNPVMTNGQPQYQEVTRGMSVRANQELGLIDDRIAKAQLRVAQNQLDVAKKRVENLVNIEYAKASHAVAEKKHLAALEANSLHRSVFTETELAEMELQVTQAKLAVEQAEHEHAVDAVNVDVRMAEVDAANVQVDLSRIKSPIDGIIIDITKHKGEWVDPGQPIIHMIRMDRVWATHDLPYPEYSPGQVEGKPVTVTAKTASGRTVQLQGEIAYAEPIIQTDNRFDVRAEIVNKKDEHGKWILMDGIKVDVKIQLD